MVTDDIKDLIADARDYDILDRMTPGELFGLAGNLADALEDALQEAVGKHDEADRMQAAAILASDEQGRLADAIEAEHQRAVNAEARAVAQTEEAHRAQAERDALRTAIQPVLDAWSIPGIRPDVHAWAKRNLHASWFTLYAVLDDLSRAIDTKEK